MPRATMFLLFLCLLGLLTQVVESSCLDNPAPLQSEAKVISVGFNNWLSSEITSHIVCTIIKEGLGFPCETTSMGPSYISDAMMNMGVDIGFEMWYSYTPEMIEALKLPIFYSITESGFQGHEGWFVPDYLVEWNSDFKHWTALLKPDNIRVLRDDYTGNLTEPNIYQKLEQQATLIANLPSNTTQEEFDLLNDEMLALVQDVQVRDSTSLNVSSFAPLYTVSADANWLTADQYLVDQLHLPLVLRPLPEPVEDNLVQNVRNLYAQRRPFITYLYTPLHLFDPRYGVNLVRVQLLEYEEHCTDGVMRPECVFPIDQIKSTTSTSLPLKSLHVSQLMKSFKLNSTEDVNRIMAHVKVDNMTVEEAACKYIRENLKYIESFYPPTQAQIYIDWTSSSGILLMVFTLILTACSLAIGIYMNIKKRDPVVKASSLGFCNAIILGSILGYLAVFTFLGKPTNVNCVFRPVLLALSFGIMYSYLLVKNFRIWRIFAKPFAASNKYLNDSNLFFVGGAVIFVEVLLMVIWFAVDYPKPAVTETLTEIIYTCESTNPNFGSSLAWSLVSFNCLLIVLGLFLAVETRRVNSRFRESKFIGLATYNMVILGIVFIPFVTVDTLTTAMNKLVILCVLILLVPFLTVVTLFGPKVTYIVKPELAPSYDSSHETPVSSSSKGNHSMTKQFPLTKGMNKANGVKGSGSGGGSNVADMKSSEVMSEVQKDESDVIMQNINLLDEGLEAMKTGEYAASY